MKKKLRTFFHQQNIRWSTGRVASATEIALSIVMIVSIILLSIDLLFDVKEIAIAVFNHKKIPSFSEFLSLIFALVIGLEFVNMLIKHTPGSAIEVVLYTIARKIIAEKGSMLDVLFGVVAIAILFAVKKYLNVRDEYEEPKHYDLIVNGGTSIKEINRRLDTDFDMAYGNTVAGYLFNYLKKQGQSIHLGLETDIGNYRFIIHEMDNELIRYIRIVPLKKD